MQPSRFSYGMLSVVIAIVLQPTSSCTPNVFVHICWNRRHLVAWRFPFLIKRHPTDLTSVDVKSQHKKYQQLVADASPDDLTRKDDGAAYFLINGNELPATKVSVHYLRNFAMRNDVRKSLPPPTTKKIWKYCVHRLEQYIKDKNRSGTNDSSGDEENNTNNNSNQYSYVYYWDHFSRNPLVYTKRWLESYRLMSSTRQ
jgi:hypothetical protein